LSSNWKAHNSLLMTKKVIEAHNSVLDLVGNTPLIKLNKTVDGFLGSYYAKAEFANPGHSNKDRIALHIIEDAERKNILKPGNTIIETTSGNTGFSIAMASIIKGYKCILAVSSKSSPDKIDMLRAMGATVYVCPGHMKADDPRSYYQVAKRLHNEIKGSVYINQYFNELNTDAHFRTTGPEIWEQTAGQITHLVAASGTGGTISGVGKFLKEKNNKIKIWGVDAYGSVLKKYHETGIFDKNEIYPYVTEGIGEDMIPLNIDFDVIDGFTKVTDKDAALYCRKLLKDEGMFLGNSAGAAIKGVLQLANEFNSNDLVVVLFHDHGSRYLKKIYNDNWMREMGYM